MSIIYDLKAINEAMQPHKVVCSNGRYLCRECYCYLGQLSEGAVVKCPSCQATNRVEE
jgi:hypothetical protein